MQVARVHGDRQLVAVPVSACAAIFRSTRAMVRSSDRTPASRVYSAASLCSASSVKVDVGRLQPGPLQLTRQQVAPGDGDLLVLGVAVQRDQLHPVQQRAGMASATFAVAMNSTSDRSSSTSR